MNFFCWSYTLVISPHAKTFEDFRDVLIHWLEKPLGCCLSQQSLLISGFRMLYDGPASRVEKKFALKSSCEKSRSSVFIRWRSNAFFMQWSVHQWLKMRYNQWLHLPNWYVASQKEQTIRRRQTHFLDFNSSISIRFPKRCCFNFVLAKWYGKSWLLRA